MCNFQGAGKEAPETPGPTATDEKKDPSVGLQQGDGLKGSGGLRDQGIRPGNRYEQSGQLQGQKPESAASLHQDAGGRLGPSMRTPRHVAARSRVAWSDPFGFGMGAMAATSLTGVHAEDGPQERAEALSTAGPSGDAQACEEDGTCALEEGDVLDPSSGPSDEPGGVSRVDGEPQKHAEDKSREGKGELIDLLQGKSSDKFTVESEGSLSAGVGRNPGHSGVGRSSVGAGFQAAGGQPSERPAPVGERQGALKMGDSSGTSQHSQASRGDVGGPLDKGSAGGAGRGQLGHSVAKQSSGLHRRDARRPGFGEQDPAFDLIDQEEVVSEDDYDMDSELDNMPNEWLDHYAEYIFNITGGYDLGYDDYYEGEY